MVGHEGQREGAGKGDGRRKLPRKEIDHRDGEGSKDQRNDTEIPFRFCKGIKLMGDNKKKRRMEEGWVLFIEFYLILETIPRILEGMDFVNPKGFLVEGVESQGKA
jgi:hypothetical protein